MEKIITILILGVFIGITGYQIVQSKHMLTTRNIILAGLFAALMAVGALLKIPFPIPITMQPLFCLLAGIILGSRLGMISMMVYTLIGLVGIPVFSYGGGLGYIFNPTFGYIIGFVLAAYFSGKLLEKLPHKSLLVYIMAALIAMLAIYVVGVPYLYLIKGLYLNEDFTFMMAIKGGFLPYVLKDLGSSILAAIVGMEVRRRLYKTGMISNVQTD